MNGRLIEQPSVHKLLIAAIAAEPVGEKLHLGRVRSRLISQADVIRAIQHLVEHGKLDPTTLRPPVKRIRMPMPEGFRRGQSRDGEPSLPLWDAVVAEAERRGLTREAASIEIFGEAQKSRIYRLRDVDTVRKATADKIRAWLAASIAEAHADAPPAAAVEPRTSPATPAPTPFALAAELRDYCTRHDLSEWRVSMHLFGARNGLARLGARSRLHEKSIRKIRALLDAPPPDGLKRQEPGGPRKPENGGVSGAELADQIEAMIAEHGLSKVAVSRMVYKNSDRSIDRLRECTPQRRIVERVRALLANPPLPPSPQPDARPAQPARAAALQATGETAPERKIDLQTDVPLGTFLKPAEIAWCSQCDQRVSGAKAARCLSRWCSLKERKAA
jgi:hypothetical protein